jgi:nitroreductase
MKDIFAKCRTIRRFDRKRPLTDECMLEVLSVVDKIASAGNLQRIRYRAITGTEAESLFPSIALGGYLPKDKKPTPEVAPTAYAVLYTVSESPDTNLAIDIGIAAEAIVLSAASSGIGSCIVRNFEREAFAISDRSELHPQLVIALGYPAERAEAVPVGADGSLRYYISDEGVNIVPKLPIDTLIIK